jgi:hypothetical protein
MSDIRKDEEYRHAELMDNLISGIVVSVIVVVITLHIAFKYYGDILSG